MCLELKIWWDGNLPGKVSTTLVQYLYSTPLHNLEKNDLAWHWEEQHEAALENVKRMISTAPVLRYYNPMEELKIQCDASQSGLGAALLQNGQPISVASQARTSMEDMLQWRLITSRWSPLLLNQFMQFQRDFKE